MRKKRSLIQIYLVSLIALAAVPVALNGVIWIATEYDKFTDQSDNLRKTFVESRSELLKREVAKAMDYIEYKESQLNRTLYQELRQEVAVALALIANMHKQSAATESRSKILARVRSTIEPLRFHEQKGFFFALQGTGRALLPPLHPQSRERLRQSAMLEQFTVQVKNATQNKNQSTLEFRFSDRGSDDTHRNVSFVYYYKPLDLYIGASVYLRDEIDRIKQEVIDRLAAVPFDVDSSVLFVTEYSGKQLVNPYNPDMLGKLQPGMDRVVDVLSQEEGGQGKLVELEWRRPGGQQRSPAVSYVELYPEWNWVVGAGFFLDEYYALLEAERQALEARVMNHTLFISAIAVALMIVATLVARRLAHLNAQGFHRFQEFFAKASESSTRINVSELPFAEFEELAHHANYMVRTRSETEYALKLSERRFQLALDASQSHLWDLDMEHDRIAVGESFYRQLGYEVPPDSVSLNKFSQIFHPEDVHVLHNLVAVNGSDDGSHSVEFRVRDNAGRYRWILSRGDIVDTSADGSPHRAMGIMSDISERKQMEGELVNARIAAEDANHAKSQFLSSASHELRTPLNGVLGYVQLLQRQKKLPEESQGYLDAIENCGQHLLNLINDVLDLAKVESGTFSISLHTANLRDILASVSDILRQRAQAKKLGYEHKVSSQVPDLIRTDEVKLRQILVNLLGNAVKFTEEGKVTLEVDFDEDRNVLLFSVIDTGVGIPQEKIKSIFEPFSRVNEHDGKGTGLGLAICRRLCEAMGGELSVTSVMGKGTTFAFDIPVGDQGIIQRDRRKGVELEVEKEKLPDLSDLTIVVADDNADNRTVLKGMLESLAKSVHVAADGGEVLDLLPRKAIDLILLDYKMPKMDGLTCLREIRANSEYNEIVVIMVTASAELDTQSRAFEYGCNDYVAKPVQFEDLLKVIAKHVRTGTAEDRGAKGRGAEGRDRTSAPAVASVPLNSETETNEAAYDGPPLPIEDRKTLLELLALGDIAAMSEFCESHKDSEYGGYADYAYNLLQNFDFQGLKDLLQANDD
ncbi:PAS domain S-box-containing protein [Litorivivens lipolytica]|uniref:histidine kinase n=1 Tax=Litorivivens lipolytica TaxID=1524264 RepID=A0A7W4W560_9GAMM|nr:cache domain-containing protein [Litorivivens lipolytica]MBB3047681.1 PAS domain S-box-containing protein [Litorivivens lipolytica]